MSSVSVTTRRMAEAALSGSRGNSGIIFAQFVQGLSEGVGDRHALDAKDFAHAMRKGCERAYQALNKPVEGTILTVMRAWTHALHALHEKTSDFVELLADSIQAAKTALRDTPKKLKVLEEAGVVDAGAEGFVHFLEGVVRFLRHGENPALSEGDVPIVEDEGVHVTVRDEDLAYRYCTEVLLEGASLDLSSIERTASRFGDSLIVAGSSERAKLHIHTNEPAELFAAVRTFGNFVQPKVDDMQRQYEAQFKRRSSIALVTDTACDLPEEVMDRYQIHLVPLALDFGGSHYLDKVTLKPDWFYTMLAEGKDIPKTSQPSVKAFERVYEYLLAHYDAVVSMHLSKALSGTWNAAKLATERFAGRKIAVIDSKHLSITLGQLVLRVAEEISEGKPFETVVRFAESLPRKARILVSVRTLKYMVRGGRVSPLKGMLAKVLNLKPIVSLDENGASTLYGKAFSWRANIAKILRMIEVHHRVTPIRSFAIGHAHASKDAEKLAEQVEAIVGKIADCVLPISPALGSHAGLGTVGVSFLLE